MILDYCIENWEGALDNLIDELEDKEEEIKEDLNIKIYLCVLEDEEYKNFEIDVYLEDPNDFENAIDKVIEEIKAKALDIPF